MTYNANAFVFLPLHKGFCYSTNTNMTTTKNCVHTIWAVHLMSANAFKVAMWSNFPHVFGYIQV